MLCFPNSVKTLTDTTYTLTRDDSGKIIVSKNSGNLAVTLPNPTNDYKDVSVRLYMSSTGTLTLLATASTMLTPGNLQIPGTQAGSGSFPALTTSAGSTSKTSCVFTGGVGTSVDVICDGTLWYVSNISNAMVS